MIVLGFALLLFTGFTWFTRKNVAEIGPIEVNKTQEHNIQWPPALGGILVITGIVVVVSGRKRN